ncbi:hypothetical protein, partial [Streptomyces sp. NPDC003832]
GGPDPVLPRGHRWRGRSARARTVTAATAVAVLALGGTVAYAATSTGTDPSASASAPSGTPDRPGERHHPGPWFGPGGDAVHGETTVRDGDEWIVRVWQRGTVRDVDGDRVTVRSEDGTEWAWTVADGTEVHRDGDSDGLKDGDEVVVSGTRSDSGERTADHVLSGTWHKEKRDPHERPDRFPRHENGPGHAPPWNNNTETSQAS